MRSLYPNIAVRAAIVPAVQAATADGATIDTLGFSSVAFAINTGAIASAGDFSIAIEESDTVTDGDFAAAPAAAVQGTTPATLVASTVYRLGYIGTKRYVRLALTKAGGTSIALGAVAILGDPADRPVS